MSGPSPTNPVTKAGLSTNSIRDEIRENNKKGGPSRAVLNTFLEDVAHSMAMQEPGDDMPEIEAPKEIVDHYNRKGLGQAKYFIFQGVKVYETGTMEQVKKDELLGH